MKRIIFIAFLSFLALKGFTQTNTILGLYGGAGASTMYNYDVGLSGGFDFLKGIGNHTALGATLFYQGYAFLYDREANYVNNGGGNAGVSILNKSSYIFIAPKISQFFGRHSTLEAYLNAGAGFKMSGTETMKNINSMVLRFGVGLKEYIHLGNGNWWFTVTEDCGFLASTLSKTSDVDDPSRTQYSPNGKLNPNYFSLMIGISHSKF